MKRHAKIRTLILALVMVMLTSVNSYAGNYEDFRDGDISMTFPDGWTFEETDVLESEGMYAEEIFRAEEENGNMMMDLQYVADEVQNDDYIYLDSQDELDYYYENYGYDTVQELYIDLGCEENLKITESASYFGEYHGYIILKVSYDYEDDYVNELVYLTAQMTRDDKILVHSIFAFYNEDDTVLTSEQQETAEDIVDGYYDYGYRNEFAGVKEDYYGYDSNSLGNFGDEIVEILSVVISILIMLLPFIIIVVIIIFVKKRKSGGTINTPVMRGLKDKLSGIQEELNLKAENFSYKPAAAESTPVRQASVQKPKRVTQPKDTRKMYEQERSNAEIRYRESLKTLHKSGLLTKSEMDDMLERHQRSKLRYRKH